MEHIIKLWDKLQFSMQSVELSSMKHVTQRIELMEKRREEFHYALTEYYKDTLK